MDAKQRLGFQWKRADEREKSQAFSHVQLRRGIDTGQRLLHFDSLVNFEGRMTVKNQTRDEWIKLAAVEVGTGFIIRKDQDDRLWSVYYRDITYTECLAQGAASFAFKWIPNSVESFESIKNTTCEPVRCEGKECAQAGCACVNRRCSNAPEEPDKGDPRVHPGLTGGHKREPELVH